ncbi:MAG TPA: branched-chain amino acid ABC transporter substrate-binding protein [Anaerolineae bacterium]|nr:branched-chain amino acid ABC transporter substrate-binding protein [Anaerolineae bacterium]
MFKRILVSVFILGGMLLSLAGCGGGEDTIKIGLQGPMTGDYAYEGKGFKNALTMLVEQVNAAGGINGKQVELLVEDDAGDPTQSALVAQRLVDAKVVAVIGAYNSTATEAASEIYNEAGILHITPSSTAVRLTTKGFPRFFRVCFLDDRQGLFAVKFMKEVLGAQNIGILHDNSTYAQGLAEETRRYAEEMGLKVGFYDAINPNDQDFTPILTKIGAANLDAVYFTGYHSQAGLLLKQSAELGLKVQWIGGNAANNPVMVEIAGLKNAAGMFVTTEPLPKDLNYPEAKKFVADYIAKYGEEPASVWTIMAGEAFNVIRIAMEQTKSTDPGVLADYIHNQLKNVNGLTGPILGFDEKGDRLGTIHVAYIIDDKGNFVLYDKQPSP